MKLLLLPLLAVSLMATDSFGQQAGTAQTKKVTKKTKTVTKTPIKPRRPTAVHLTDADAEKSVIKLAVGDTMVLALAENPTTGYRWAVTTAPAKGKMRPVGDDYASKPADSKMVGVGGTRHFRFVALAAGKTQLELQNRREWQKDSPEQRLRITVEIK